MGGRRATVEVSETSGPTSASLAHPPPPLSPPRKGEGDPCCHLSSLMVSLSNHEAWHASGVHQPLQPHAVFHGHLLEVADWAGADMRDHFGRREAAGAQRRLQLLPAGDREEEA